jgi:hypothetical protein
MEHRANLLLEQNNRDLPMRYSKASIFFDNEVKKMKRQTALPTVTSKVAEKEILEMKEITYASRKLSTVYKRDAVNQLLNEFPYVFAKDVNRIFILNSGHFLPAYRELRQFRGPLRKTLRPFHPTLMPKNVELVLLQEIQLARKEKQNP